MNGLRQGWLVALREMRERGRSRAFLASLVIMVMVVLGVILVPAMLDTGRNTVVVGLTGAVPDELPAVLASQGEAAGVTVRVTRYANPPDGERAVRQGDVDVLVVDAQQLQWPGRIDQQLRAGVTAAIQLVAVRERAVSASVDPDDLTVLVAPVPVGNIELGPVAGGSPDDETAAMVMTVLLFTAISIYGTMVLTGVVEEKSSRVVEVLLARIPPRSLLAGKVAGIGLLGLAQFGVTALAALVALAVVDSVEVPAARGTVLAWVVVWFVLGYAVYATLYGALGSLASRTEDAQSVASPVVAVLIAGYFASFATLGSPGSVIARLLSMFPLTAPLAMPNRMAIGAAAWWEVLLAVALTMATIVGLTLLGGRVSAAAILHTGPTLRLRDAWSGRPDQPSSPEPYSASITSRRSSSGDGSPGTANGSGSSPSAMRPKRSMATSTKSG